MLEQFFWTIKTWTWSSSAFKKLFSVFFRNKVTRLVFEIFAQNVAQFIFGQNNKKLGYFFHYQKNPETNHPMGENSPNLVTLFRNKRCFSKWVGLPLNVIFDQDYFLPANEGYNLKGRFRPCDVTRLKWTSLSWQGNLHTNICMFVIWKKYFRRNSVNPISKTYICIMYRYFTHNVRKYVHNTNDWYFLSDNIYIICDTVINLCNK
jgi:hypothetical protein